MTKEQENALNHLKRLVGILIYPDDVNAIRVGIQAIKDFDEIQDILDKIKTEIDHDMREAPYMYDDEHFDELCGYQDGLEHTLNIIDKYRGEI